ncbi:MULTISPECIES: DUF262 domain-containing protein [unclassified Enterococcus]|uniref:DUF262 domain-containing protein n=1 Tax=unclassified Enterococcus TaxID=2608891 RepID=UPI001CE1B69A|nr:MULTISPECIES: DUF262 domain-containing protein [unclassified Enterococcus]MCA5011778.1 DUF262 domain-containing protein [Enterococcus sp. S23]MCA5014780.1 DUF262 domain-containing protein [Enterococcus sp. S22(2020)]
MKFKYTENTKTISEVHKLIKNEDLIVDHSYQRRAIWSEKDQIRLIETILLNYVVPSVYFWQSEIDSETGDSITHIVDGQQRLNSIDQFVKGNLILKTKDLLDEEAQKLYGNKSFAQLTEGEKKDFWGYKISVIEIDPNANEENVIKMFNRLNLTEYTLNNQEKRHANFGSGKFHEFASELSENELWEYIKIFSARDIKRMQDVTFCANLIILSKRGIVDQSKIDEPINEAYEKYKDNYPEINEDKQIIEQAIRYYYNIIEKIGLNRFIRTKIQVYSLFSLIFHMIREGIEFLPEHFENLSAFINLYNNHVNTDSQNMGLTSEQSDLYDQVNRYKLSSSEGVNKLSNRTTRFFVLKDLILKSRFDTSTFDSLNGILETIKSDTKKAR